MTQLRNLTVLVYADTAAMQECARAMAADPRLARCRLELRSGGIIEAAAWLRDHPSPDVLVVGDAADETITTRLDQLAHNVEAGCKVIVIGHRDSIAVYRQLTTTGVADYLGGNVRPGELFDALARLYGGSHPLPKGKLIACLSAVGGAGGSTIAAFLADSLHERLGETILLDLDLAMGTAGLMMGVDVRDPVAGAFANPGLDVALLERMLVRDKSARVLSTGGALKDAALFDPDVAERVVDVARSMSKILVVDLPKGWGSLHERLLVAADEVIVVTGADLPALRNARMILDHLRTLRLDGPAPRLVLNKIGAARSREYRGDELREALGIKPAATISFEPDALVAAMTAGKPITSARGKAAAAMRAFAGTVLATASRTGRVRTASLLPALKTLFMKPA